MGCRTRGLQWNPWRGWGNGSRRHPPEVGPKQSGILLRNRTSQVRFNSKEPTPAGGAQPIPPRLPQPAAAEGGCWISHFPRCCEKMPSKKQRKEEKDALGSSFKGTAHPSGKFKAQRDEHWCSEPSLLCTASRTLVHGVATPESGAV